MSEYNYFKEIWSINDRRSWWEQYRSFTRKESEQLAACSYEPYNSSYNSSYKHSSFSLGSKGLSSYRGSYQSSFSWSSYRGSYIGSGGFYGYADNDSENAPDSFSPTDMGYGLKLI